MGKLGRPGAPLAKGLVQRIGEICSGGDEAAAEGDFSHDQLVQAAHRALGEGLRSLGPEVILEALPLNLEQV